MYAQIILIVLISYANTSYSSKENGDTTWNSSQPKENIFKMHRGNNHIMFFMPKNGDREVNVDECDDSDFPEFISPEALKNGAVVVCIIIAIYCFTFLAIVCDQYFLPCVIRFCETCNITEDVAGATFMAMATTAPEFFINVVGTFVTESDIGIGTVVGSNMYNTLAVPALGCLAAAKPIQLDWWPVARDSFIYICTIALLVGLAWDGNIYWYKSLTMFIALIMYFVILFNNKPLARFFKKLFSKCSCPTDQNQSSDNNLNFTIPPIITISDIQNDSKIVIQEKKIHKLESETETENIFEIPNGVFHKIWFFYSWPIKFLLYVLLPNPNKKSYIFLVTFMLCIILIGLNSYVISWMMTLIGGTMALPDSVLGLTFLSFGGGLPETISIVILSRKGEGSIGVSNALGANTINILMSLGLPWFIKNLTLGLNNNSSIEIISGSIVYTILGLLLVVALLFITLYVNKFKLSRAIGIFLSFAYIILLTMAIVNEVLLVTTIPC